MCGEAAFDYMFLMLSGVNTSQSQFELGSPFSKPAIFTYCSISLLLAHADSRYVASSSAYYSSAAFVTYLELWSYFILFICVLQPASHTYANQWAV